jgi:hypothetical protein
MTLGPLNFVELVITCNSRRVLLITSANGSSDVTVHVFEIIWNNVLSSLEKFLFIRSIWNSFF